MGRGNRVDNCSLLVLLMVAASCARVTTKFGDITGLWSRSSRGRLVTHYLGIPYARPPLGDLRFRVSVCFIFLGRGTEFFGKIFSNGGGCILGWRERGGWIIIIICFWRCLILRQSPQPWDETWNGTFEATKNAPPCYQMSKDGNMIGEEDCLYLNVYVPKVSGEREVWK